MLLHHSLLLGATPILLYGTLHRVLHLGVRAHRVTGKRTQEIDHTVGSESVGKVITKARDSGGQRVTKVADDFDRGGASKPKDRRAPMDQEVVVVGGKLCNAGSSAGRG